MRTFIWTICLLGVMMHVHAQLGVRSVEVIPDTFYVGDEAIMRMVIDRSIDEDAASIGFVEEIDWGEITNISYRSDGRRTILDIRFVAYRPGTIVFPHIFVGTYTIQGYSAFVASVLDSANAEVESFKDIMMYPRIRLYIFLGVVVLGIISAVLFFIVHLCKQLSFSSWRLQLKTRYTIKKCYQAMLKQFLQNNQQLLFEEITRFIRIILAKVYHPSLQSATRSELAEAYKQHDIDSKLHGHIQSLLNRANDSVYAGRQFSTEELSLVRMEVEYVQKAAVISFRHTWMHDRI